MKFHRRRPPSVIEPAINGRRPPSFINESSSSSFRSGAETLTTAAANANAGANTISSSSAASIVANIEKEVSRMVHYHNQQVQQKTRKSSRKALPKVPIEQQIWAELETVRPLANIHTHSPKITEFTTNMFKRQLIVDLLNEKIDPNEARALDLSSGGNGNGNGDSNSNSNSNGKSTEQVDYLDISPALQYFRNENPIFQKVEDSQLMGLHHHITLYPSVAALSDRLSNYNISTTAITNVTEKNQYVERLFENHSYKPQRKRRPHSVATLSSIGISSNSSGQTVGTDNFDSNTNHGASSKLKKFSQKAKRFSYYADNKVNSAGSSLKARYQQQKQQNYRLSPSDASSFMTRTSTSTSTLTSDINYTDNSPNYSNDTDSLATTSASSSLDDATSGLMRVNQIDTQAMAKQQNEQFFVKYHIFSFDSRRMILTTNPDRKHLYCKYAPGYTVDIQLPRLSKENAMAINQDSGPGGDGPKQSDFGFRLIIKENYGEDSKPVIVVTKKSKIKGNGYAVWILRNSILNDENEIVDVGDGDGDGKAKAKASQSGEYWQGQLSETSFYESYQNADLINELKRSDTKHIMNRYEFKDFNDLQWMIGSIPKIKKSNFSKLKHYLRDILEGNSYSDIRANVNGSSGGNGSKISHKYNVYFFTQFDPNNVLRIKVPEGNANHSTQMNKVLALFRPHETKVKKKLVKDLKRLKHISSEHNYIHGGSNGTSGNGSYVRNFNGDYNHDYDHNYSSMESPSLSDLTSIATLNTTSTGFDQRQQQHQQEQHAYDNKREIFYQPGDGIIRKNTPDDSPNDHKLGWLTIYNEPYLREPGMFELVLGVTLAVGYERVVNMQVAMN